MKIVSWVTMEKLENGYKVEHTVKNEGGTYFYETKKIHFESLKAACKAVLDLEKQFKAEAELEQTQDEVAVINTANIPF